MVNANPSDISSLGSKVESIAPMEYFECDYEKDCTPLYKAIENAIVQEEEDYEHIAVYLETGSWPASTPGLETFNTSNAAPAEVQAKTWVTRFSVKEKKRVEWSQLPLHLAIVGGAPSNIIGGLVKLYPQALRCTDDQHMLPLHLALRHGADDEIVAYLLMQFPDAANAKGKSGRLPVDCALRARDKLRGIIIETFVEKTKSKLQTQHLKEKTELAAAVEDTVAQLDKVKEELAAKTAALNELYSVHTTTASELESLKEQKAKTEEELSTQVNEIAKEKAEMEENAQQKIERLTSEKLTESIELQKKIEAMAAEKLVAENAVQEAKEQEAAARRELDVVEANVAKAGSTDEWNALKSEVDSLQSVRLTRSKSQTKDNIESLKGEIQKTINETKSEAKTLKSELKSLQKTVTKLEKTESAAKSSDEVAKLQSEVEILRAELRERSEASKVKVELAVLKRSMEAELKKTEGKSEKEIAAIESVVAKSGPTELESKSLVELKALKSEIEAISLHLKETELARKTNVDVTALETSLEKAIAEADPKIKGELTVMKPAVENLRKYVANIQSNDDLVAAAKDVETLKDLLHKKVATSKVLLEARNIKKSIDRELALAAGKAQEKELIQMREAVSAITSSGIENKELDDLAKFNGELGIMKKHLRQVEQANKTQQELDALKKTVEEELLRATEKAKQDLIEMKKAVDAVNLEQQESKQVKESLTSEIKRASGKTEQDLLALKEKVDAINLQDLESKNKGEWDSIRSELESLKVDLKQKQQMKLEDTEKELASVKEAIAQINAEQETKTNTKFEELRQEMMALREDLSPPPQPKKAKGGGLMKLIASRFRRAPTRAEAKSAARSATNARPEEEVPTILPPSVSVVSPTVSAASSPRAEGDSDDEGSMPPALQKIQSMEKDQVQEDSKQKEVTLALFQSFSQQAAEEERQAKIDAAAVQAMPSFTRKAAGKMPPSAMRKVRSMDPRIKNVTIDPADIVRSWSKTHVQASGEVELESVAENRGETATDRV
jgi:hypothetical protein